MKNEKIVRKWYNIINKFITPYYENSEFVSSEKTDIIIRKLLKLYKNGNIQLVNNSFTTTFIDSIVEMPHTIKQNFRYEKEKFLIITFFKEIEIIDNSIKFNKTDCNILKDCSLGLFISLCEEFKFHNFLNTTELYYIYTHIGSNAGFLGDRERFFKYIYLLENLKKSKLNKLISGVEEKYSYSSFSTDKYEVFDSFIKLI